MAIDAHRTTVGHIEAADTVHKRRFTRTVYTNDPQHLASTC